jgi:hypothetical protein
MREWLMLVASEPCGSGRAIRCLSLTHEETVSLHLQVQAPEDHQDNEIRPAKMSDAPLEKPGVWFSFHSRWEPTATKTFVNPLTGRREFVVFERMGPVDPPARIEIDPSIAPTRWNEFVQLSGIPPEMAREVERIARKRGANPDEWRVCFEAVSFDASVTVEIHVNNNGSMPTSIS